MTIRRGTVDERGNFTPNPLAKVLPWPQVRRFKIQPRRRRKVLAKVLEFRSAGVSARHGRSV